MRKVVPKEGPRAPLFCLGAVLLIVAGGTAAAQTVEQSDLERCASLATAELKLACFEALAASKDTEAEPAADEVPDPPPESATTRKALTTAGTAIGVAESSDAGRVAPAAAAVADDEQSDSPDELSRVLADEEQVDLANELGLEQPDDEQANVVDEVGQGHPDEEQANAAEDIGREHLDEETDDKKEEAVVRVTVSEVVRGSYDVLYFHLTNGQVWRQIESRRFRYPRDGEFDVVIDTGMMGDYRLRLDTGGPMTQIRRVK